MLLFDYFPELLKGLATTFELAAIGLAMGFVLGWILVLLRKYGGKVLSPIATAYVEFIRGTPMLVQLFIIYFGLVEYGIDNFTAAFLTLGINSGAYQSEYFRQGIESIGQGQIIAARAIGMNRLQIIRHIILPQAIRIALPAWSNEAAYLPKYGVVAFAIAVQDILSKAKWIVPTWSLSPLEVYGMVALLFVICISAISKILDIVYKRVKIPGF